MMLYTMMTQSAGRSGSLLCSLLASVAHFGAALFISVFDCLVARAEPGDPGVSRSGTSNDKTVKTAPATCTGRFFMPDVLGQDVEFGFGV